MKKRDNGICAGSELHTPMVGRVQIHIAARGEVVRGAKMNDGRSFWGIRSPVMSYGCIGAIFRQIFLLSTGKNQKNT